MSQEQLGQRPAMGPALLDVNVLIALLALAVHHGGRLVSFDRRLSCEAVAGGREAL